MDSGSNSLAIATALLFVAAIYHHIKRFSFWSSRGLKGPTPWPVFGTNIYYIFRLKIDVDIDWHQKYGDTFGIYEGYQPVLRTRNNELIKRIWIKEHANFTDRNNKFIYGDNISRWLFWSEGEHWSNQRALVSPAFTSRRMKAMFVPMMDSVGRFLREIENRLTANGSIDTRQKTIFSKDELMYVTLDVIAKCFFGLKIDTYKEKTSDFFKRAFAFAKFDFGRFLVWMSIPNPLAKRFKVDLVSPSKYEYFDKLSAATITERRKNPPQKRQDDFIQSLMEAKLPESSKNYVKIYSPEDDLESHYNDRIGHEELEKINEKASNNAKFRHFNDIEIRAQMTFFFLAGFETTSTSLTFCLYELAHNPEFQEQVYQEIKEAQLDLEAQQAELANGEYTRLLGLSKLDAFVSEALRLYSPVTEHNRLVTAENGVELPVGDLKLRLPKGCAISVNGFCVQRCENYWRDPMSFDPARFYPENRDKIVSGSYMPFGLGPRNCLGMRFALLNIKLILASMLSKYRVAPGPRTQLHAPEFTRHAFFLQLQASDFALIPR